jgi:hypothetical protein
MSKTDPYEGMTTEELLAAMPPWKEDVERLRQLGLECPKTATEAEALLKRVDPGLKRGPDPGLKRGGAGMSLDRRREVLTEAERRLIEEEKRWIEAREANRPLIEERRKMGEYHAAMKHAHMEAEYWAKQRSNWNYDPIKLFEQEIEDEIS